MPKYSSKPSFLFALSVFKLLPLNAIAKSKKYGNLYFGLSLQNKLAQSTVIQKY